MFKFLNLWSGLVFPSGSLWMKKGHRVLSASSSSHQVHVQGTEVNAAGHAVRTCRTLNAKHTHEHKLDEHSLESGRLRGLTPMQRCTEASLRDIPDFDTSFDNTLSDILDGTAQADISHAGENLTPEEAEKGDKDLWVDLYASHKEVTASYYCTRCNRTSAMFDALEPQMDAIADAYLVWHLRSTAGGLGTLLEMLPDAMVEGTLTMVVIDLFIAYIADEEEKVGPLGDRGGVQVHKMSVVNPLANANPSACRKPGICAANRESVQRRIGKHAAPLSANSGCPIHTEVDPQHSPSPWQHPESRSPRDC
ncbi:hypothetical protein B0H10DRAFT_2308124 [Mycena sp. CBHHK59/15]|nr:hypothetical protein B0H10DRAFT_2308124 [Mycena sp. CBHHK59/15]